jgi:triosephosphate isomerase
VILVNFKTYKEASGESATSLAHVICDLVGETGVEIISCPQAVDLRNVAKASDHPTWAQHVDAVDRGRATGWLPPEIAKEKGVEGTLLNHSEHKLSVGILSETLNRCKEVGLKTLVFVDSLDEAKVVAKFAPDIIGYEPPELVGSKETSVSKAKPEVIEKVVKAISNIPILVGAGVKDKKDVEMALKLGAMGIGVSSAVVLAKSPKDKLRELAQGFKK